MVSSVIATPNIILVALNIFDKSMPVVELQILANIHWLMCSALKRPWSEAPYFTIENNIEV